MQIYKYIANIYDVKIFADMNPIFVVPSYIVTLTRRKIKCMRYGHGYGV